MNRAETGEDGHDRGGLSRELNTPGEFRPYQRPLGRPNLTVSTVSGKAEGIFADQ